MTNYQDLSKEEVIAIFNLIKDLSKSGEIKKYTKEFIEIIGSFVEPFITCINEAKVANRNSIIEEIKTYMKELRLSPENAIAFYLNLQQNRLDTIREVSRNFSNTIENSLKK